jgi:hypothetical protein
MNASRPPENPVPLPRQQRAPGSRGRDERAAQAHLDALLDDALAHTFPASDPVASLAPAA